MAGRRRADRRRRRRTPAAALPGAIGASRARRARPRRGQLNGKLQQTVRIDGDRLYTLVTQPQANGRPARAAVHAGPLGLRVYVRLELGLLGGALALGPAVATLALAQEPRQLRCEGVTGGKLLLVVQQLGTLARAPRRTRPSRRRTRPPRSPARCSAPTPPRAPRYRSHTEHVAQPLAERERGARARRERDVVRDRRPEADGRDARAAAGVVEDPDDSRRALVARTLRGRARSISVRVGRAARHRRRPRVRHVGEQRAEGDHHLDAEIPREVDDQPREGLSSGGSARCRAGGPRRGRARESARGRRRSPATRCAGSAPRRARRAGGSPGSRRSSRDRSPRSAPPPRPWRGSRPRATRPGRRRSSHGMRRPEPARADSAGR